MIALHTVVFPEAVPPATPMKIGPRAFAEYQGRRPESCCAALASAAIVG